MLSRDSELQVTVKVRARGKSGRVRRRRLNDSVMGLSGLAPPAFSLGSLAFVAANSAGATRAGRNVAVIRECVQGGPPEAG